MKVVDNTSIKRPSVYSIAIGTVFKCDSRVYMKIDTGRHTGHDFQVKTPVVILPSGSMTMIDNEVVVQVVDAELHIK